MNNKDLFFIHHFYAFIIKLFVIFISYYPKSSKLWKSLEMKEKSLTRFKYYFQNRKNKQKYILFHVASAGELLQAFPVITFFKEKDFNVVLTYSSISAKIWIEKNKSEYEIIDFYDSLPIDNPHNMKIFLELIEPHAIIFTKFDLWPGIIFSAYKSNIPLYLISATLHQNSLRIRNFFGRILYKKINSCFKGIYCSSEIDKINFSINASNRLNLKVLGDTRIDNVLQRSKNICEYKFSSSGNKVFIAGSIWPEDADHIFTGTINALRHDGEFVTILTFHEGSEKNFSRIESFFEEFKIIKLSEVKEVITDEFRVIINDKLGILASLYEIGDIAYIGGGFTTGVHNVMEPCIKGIPTIFGPKYKNAPEVVGLVKSEYGFTINQEEEFDKIIHDFTENLKYYQQLGDLSKNYVNSLSGASERCFNEIYQDLKNVENALYKNS